MQRGAAGIAGRQHHHGLTVGRRFVDRLLGNDAGALRVVFDHERLAEPLGEFLAQHPADDVGTAARGRADDDAHRPGGPASAPWQCGSSVPQRARRQPQQRSSADDHSVVLARLDAGSRDHAAPGLDLARHSIAVLLGRRRRRNVAGLREFGDDVRQASAPNAPRD